MLVAVATAAVLGWLCVASHAAPYFPFSLCLLHGSNTAVLVAVATAAVLGWLCVASHTVPCLAWIQLQLTVAGAMCWLMC